MHLSDTRQSIFVAGHRGLVGSGVVRALKKAGYDNLILRSRQELDLSDADAVRAFYREEQPDFVVVAAAKVGGILANDTYPADFLHTNLEIQSNVIHGAFESGAKRLLFWAARVSIRRWRLSRSRKNTC